MLKEMKVHLRDILDVDLLVHAEVIAGDTGMGLPLARGIPCDAHQGLSQALGNYPCRKYRR